MRINATTGEIISDKPRRLGAVPQSGSTAPASAPCAPPPVSLAELLPKIEADTKAKVREGSLEKDRGQTFYEVELADAGRHVLIDPRTGAIREGRIDD